MCKPASDEQAEDKVTESPVLGEAKNDTLQSQICVEEIESSQIHDGNEIIESEEVIESGGDRVVEVVTIENECGLGVANVSFEDSEARQTEALPGPSTSGETSVVTELERIENDHRENVTVEAETETAIEKKEAEMSLVTKIDELDTLNVSEDPHKNEKESDVSVTIDIANNAPAPRTPKSINQEEVATATSASNIHTSDASHEHQKRSAVTLPKSSNDNESVPPVNEEPPLKTLRRKRLPVQEISVPMSPRTPRNRQLPARFLESVVYSASTPKTPRSTRKVLEKSVKKSNNSSESIPSGKLLHCETGKRFNSLNFNFQSSPIHRSGTRRAYRQTG